MSWVEVLIAEEQLPAVGAVRFAYQLPVWRAIFNFALLSVMLETVSFLVVKWFAMAISTAHAESE